MKEILKKEATPPDEEEVAEAASDLDEGKWRIIAHATNLYILHINI